MSADHEAAKAQAADEARRLGDRLPLNRRQELRDRIWETADTDERAALRAEYALAGWSLCAHSDCPPDSCRG